MNGIYLRKFDISSMVGVGEYLTHLLYYQSLQLKYMGFQASPNSAKGVDQGFAYLETNRKLSKAND